MKLENFVRLMTGHFDNREQFEAMQKAGKIGRASCMERV